MKVQQFKAVSSLGLLMVSAAASAVDFKLANDAIEGSWVTNVTAAAGFRTKNPSCALTGDPNAHGCGAAANVDQWGFGDMGNLNYRRWQPFSTSVGVTSEVLLRMPSEGLKLMVRGTAYYDAAAGRTDRTPLADDARSQLVRNANLLDAWIEKDFALGEQAAHLRFGNQVINWGESYFATGGINQTNSVDIQRLLVPGTQLKQALLPAPMLEFSSSIMSGLSLQAYYQLQWNGNRYPPVGSYWSVGNNFGRGALPTTVNSGNFNVGGVDAGTIAGPAAGNAATIGAINRGLVKGDYAGAPFFSLGVPVDVTLPGNKPQFGVKLSYKPEDLDVNFGFYYLNYTDKAPVLSTLANGNNRFSYRQGRQLFGASANFSVGDWAIGTELSYRPRDAVSLSGCFGAGGPLDSNTNGVGGIQCDQWVDRKKVQFDINGQLSLTPSSYPALNLIKADMAVLTAELAFIDYPGWRGDGTVTRDQGGTRVTQAAAAGYFPWLNRASGLGYPIIAPKGSARSAGATVDFNWTYDGSVLPGWQVTPGVTYSHALYGYTPTFTANYLQGARSANVYLLLNRNPATWQLGVNYTAFFGGHETVGQAYADRNFIGMFATRNF